MKKISILCFLSLFSLQTMATDLSRALYDRLFIAVYEEHKCDEVEFYTESVCEGYFLSNLSYNAEFDAYEVEYEFEPGFFIHAIAFNDGEVTVTYWTK